MNTSPRKFRVVKYARVSTEQQSAEDRFSIDAQLSEMDEHIKRMGWESAGEFIERGVSGTKRYRPQLDAMINFVEKGGVDIVLVHELSRLSRSVFDTLDLFQVFGRMNVGFVSVKDPDFDFSDPTKRFFLVILSAINEYYINLLKLHTSKAKRQRAKQGLYNASITPYGYQFVGDPRTPPQLLNPEAEAVKMAFEHYATGNHSYQEIADMLSNAGYVPRGRKKKGEGLVATARRFSKDSIGDMLRNPFYIGKVAYRIKHGRYEEIYDGQHDAIIDTQTWERCQRVFSSRRAASRAAQNEYKVYLLSNLARCDVCERKLRSQHTTSDVTYYREMSYSRGYDDCPNQKNGVRTEVVDRQMSAIVQAIQLPDDWQSDLARQLEDSGGFDKINRQRDRLEAERRRLKAMRLHGDFDDDPDLYNAELARIRREIDSLPTEDQLENLKTSAELVVTMGKAWESADPEDQRDLIRLMFREVHVDVTTGRIVSLIPQAVMLPLLREVGVLEEREFGVFVPVWRPELDAKVMAVTSVEPVIDVPVRPAAAPLLCSTLPAKEADIQISLSVNQALAMRNSAGSYPEMVIQLTYPERAHLPVNLRKWPVAAVDEMGLRDLFNRPDESVDVLISQFTLWDNAVTGNYEPDRLLEDIYRKLTPGGVWYFIDLLPLDMPASWVYRFFPVAWDWVKEHTWDFHSLYTRFQSAGFLTEAKRKTIYQPVGIDAAIAVAKKKSSMLAKLQEEQFMKSYSELQDASIGRNQSFILPSETSLVEFWAQKPYQKTE